MNSAGDTKMNANETYMICDEFGTQYCDGLEYHEVDRIAKQWANRVGKTVYICCPDVSTETVDPS